jgi:hypothetical protein
MVTNSKARQANDITIGEAQALDAMARRLAADAKGNPTAIHALLIGTARRQQDRLLAQWGLGTLFELSQALAALPGVRHG